jgi:hypothetical protein
MLSLSERCPALTDLHIAGVKKVSALVPFCCRCCEGLHRCDAQVSDVGLRYLSQGCPRIQTLDATGVFLITDGKQRDFGLEGLQVPWPYVCARASL